MKNLLTLLAVLLVAICFVADQTTAKDRPYGYPDDGDMHPWGGDEGYAPGSDSYGPRTANTISTGFLPLDIIINTYLVKPALQESSKVTRTTTPSEPIRTSVHLKRSPYYNHTDLQR